LTIVNINKNACGANIYEARTESDLVGGIFETIMVTDNYSQTKCLFSPEEMPGKTVIEYTRSHAFSPNLCRPPVKAVLEASTLVNVPYIHN
jgi:hypothetical protein